MVWDDVYQAFMPSNDYFACMNCADKLWQEENELWPHENNPRSCFKYSPYADVLSTFLTQYAFLDSACLFHQLYENKCFFTHAELEESELVLLRLPVGGETQYISGGMIPYAAALRNDPAFSKALRALSNLMIGDRCVKCGKVYHLDACEYEYRFVNEKLGDYYCFECTPNKTGELERYVETTCSMCKEHPITIDVMEQESINKSICSFCTSNGQPVFQVNNLRLYKTSLGKWVIVLTYKTAGGRRNYRSAVFDNYPTMEEIMKICSRLST